jgi:hypothetical protein
MPETRPVFSPEKLHSARNGSDLIGMWPLCREAACRKAGQCRAPFPVCYRECLHLVPPRAAAFAFALDEVREGKLSFEEVVAQMPDEIKEEWDNWHKALERITGRASMKR